MPSSGYKWLDLLIALFVFLVVVWAIITIAGMIFDGDEAARFDAWVLATLGLDLSVEVDG